MAAAFRAWGQRGEEDDDGGKTVSYEAAIIAVAVDVALPVGSRRCSSATSGNFCTSRRAEP